jgi:antibiotic biosynthesis monooxygenase (ABM) superfamily enzyme
MTLASSTTGTPPPTPVKVVFERRVRPGADAGFREWSERFVQMAKRFPGHEGASVLAIPNSESQFVLVRFASPADLERWQGSPEYATLIREADALGPAGPYSETRTGLETWFTLPDQPVPAAPPPEWKMALVTWFSLLPMVIALAFIFAPFRLPFLVEVSLSTAIPVAMLTWVVMPRLTRLLYGWLYAK